MSYRNRCLNGQIIQGRNPHPSLFNNTVQEIHCRRPDKACHKFIGRIIIQINRPARLFNHPRTQHNYFISQRHRLDLIMGDIDHRSANLFVQARNLNPHINAQFGIEI